jgi:hypothetical protein
MEPFVTMNRTLTRVLGLLAVGVLSTALTARADDFSAQLAGSGDDQGFAALRIVGTEIEFGILTGGIGTPTGAQLLQGANVLVNLNATFNFGSATGSVTSAADLAAITASPGNYSIRVEGPAGVIQGPLALAGTGGGGGDDGGDGGDGGDGDGGDDGGDGGGDGGDPDLIETGDTSACDDTDPTVACLGADDRFEVTLQFVENEGVQPQAAQANELTSDTGYFTFFDPTNVEVFVKVLAACGINQHYWVFAGGATDRGVEILVRDTNNGLARRETSTLGQKFDTKNNTSALPTCP